MKPEQIERLEAVIAKDPSQINEDDVKGILKDRAEVIEWLKDQQRIPRDVNRYLINCCNFLTSVQRYKPEYAQLLPPGYGPC